MDMSGDQLFAALKQLVRTETDSEIETLLAEFAELKGPNAESLRESARERKTFLKIDEVDKLAAFVRNIFTDRGRMAFEGALEISLRPGPRQLRRRQF